MLTKTSVTGAVMQMVSHGLMTALFFAAIGMMYSRTHTRLVSQLGGLLKVMPFISSIFIIAGLVSLGLPGFSGFVSEMTVFVGAWQNPNMWYRIATILSCASIVVTAVYILRAAGSSVMGPIKNDHYQSLTDALWNERLAAVVLLSGIVVIGMAPFLLTDLLAPGTDAIMGQIFNTVK
jgi:NADH-quinone oxidoreductase subunit M